MAPRAKPAKQRSKQKAVWKPKRQFEEASSLWKQFGKWPTKPQGAGKSPKALQPSTLSALCRQAQKGLKDVAKGVAAEAAAKEAAEKTRGMVARKEAGKTAAVAKDVAAEVVVKEAAGKNMVMAARKVDEEVAKEVAADSDAKEEPGKTMGSANHHVKANEDAMVVATAEAPRSTEVLQRGKTKVEPGNASQQAAEVLEAPSGKCHSEERKRFEAECAAQLELVRLWRARSKHVEGKPQESSLQQDKAQNLSGGEGKKKGEPDAIANKSDEWDVSSIGEPSEGSDGEEGLQESQCDKDVSHFWFALGKARADNGRWKGWADQELVRQIFAEVGGENFQDLIKVFKEEEVINVFGRWCCDVRDVT